jgi:hypothetical protein
MLQTAAQSRHLTKNKFPSLAANIFSEIMIRYIRVKQLGGGSVKTVAKGGN